MQGLGYERYGAQGGDFGASVTTYMALDEPAPLLGIHLHMIDDTPYFGGRPLSAPSGITARRWQRGTRSSAATARSSRPSRRPSPTG